MFKKITISILASTCLLAGYLEDFANQNYESAYNEALKECEIDCSSEELNLIIAKSAEKTGRTQEAIAAYDRVLIINEDNFEARLSLANIYRENGNPELMKDELKYALDTLNLSDDQKKRLEHMLYDLEPKSKNYNLNLNIGFGYDSNPKHWHKDYDIKGAFSNIAGANGSYNFNIKNNFDLEIFANVYNKKYFKKSKDDFPDISIFTIGFKPKYNINNQTFALQTSYDYILFRGKSLLSSINAGFAYEHMLNDFYLYSLEYNYSKGIFSDRDYKESDYNHHSIELANYFVISNNILYLTLAYDIEKAKKTLINSDYNSIEAKLGVITPITNSLSIKPEFNYTRTGYKKTDLKPKKRNDNEYNLSTNLIYQIDKNQAIDFNVSYNKIKSNISEIDNDNYSTYIKYNYGF